MEQNQKYFAFISYKREDEKWAKKLKHTLEHYHLPSSLNGRELPKNLRYVFRDIEGLSGGDLSPQIHDALEKSKNLIVICSPRAAANPTWINKEINYYFHVLGRKKQIYPFIIEGKPHAKVDEVECFPSALLDITKEEDKLGGNINEGGSELAAVKLIAGMLGLQLIDLWNPYEKEMKMKRWFRRGAIAVLFIIVSVITFWLYSQNRDIMKNQARAVAEKANVLIDEGDSYTARRLLLEVSPKNWIWKIWPNRPYVPEVEAAFRRAANMECYTLTKGAYNTGLFANCSSDGQYIITGSNNGNAKIWNLITGQCVLEIKAKNIYFATFSPNQNYVLTILGNGSNSSKESNEILLWDTNTGKCVKTLKGHTKFIRSAAFYGNKHIVSTSGDGTFCVWDVETGRCTKTISTGRMIYVKKPLVGNIARSDVPQSMSISSDGRKMITCYGNNTIDIWDLQLGLCIDSIKGHSDAICSIKYSPSDSLIASCSYDNTIKIWDAYSCICKRELIGHTSAVYDIDWGNDNKTLVSASNDSIVRIWNIENGNCEYKIKLDASVCKVSFVPNGKCVVMVLNDRSARIWNYKVKETLDIIDQNTKIKTTSSFNGQSLSTWHLISVAVSDKGQFAIKDVVNDVRIWDIKSNKILFSLYDTYYVNGISYSSDKSRIITTTYHNGVDKCIIQIWDAKTGSLINSVKYDDNSADFNDRLSHAILHEDKIIAIADSTIYIWDIQKGAMIKSIPCKSIFSYWMGAIVAFSPINDCVAVADYNNNINVYNITTGKLKYILEGHSEGINQVVFSPDENFVYTASSDGTIIVWDSRDGEKVSVLGGNFHRVNSISFGGSGQYLTAAYDNGLIRIWDLSTEECIYAIEENGKRMVRALLCDQFIFALSDDGIIYKWPFPPLQDLIDETRERFKNRQLTLEERKKYYLE